MGDSLITDRAVINHKSKRFVFISDLHFDRASPFPLSFDEIRQLVAKIEKGKDPPARLEYQPDDTAPEREHNFIQFVKKNFSNDILILGGDFYTDFRQSLSFVKKLETAKVESYFVLGNHDFSSNDETWFDDIIQLFNSETISHKYCKFLMTGKKYYHEDVCIIGDTGWNLSNRIGPDSIMHIDGWVFGRASKKWIRFAKKTLAHEKKVLIVTHFPQGDFPQSRDWKFLDWVNADLWLDADHCWKIFGHTHDRRLFQFKNNVCLQEGYKQRKEAPRAQPYAMSDFGILEKRRIKNSGEVFNLKYDLHHILPFYSPKIIRDAQKELEAVKEITGRGFKRAGHADNKRAIADLITDKRAYIDSIKKSLDSIERVEYIDYILTKSVSPKTVNAVNEAIDILENVDPVNARPFMTAVVITSYVYSNMINHIEQMRPVDDYDIMRWFLLFATIQKFDFDPREIKTVRKNEMECFRFHHVPVYLPKVNGQSLQVPEALAILNKTLLLEGRVEKSNRSEPGSYNPGRPVYDTK